MSELACADAIIKGTEGGGVGEDVRWQNSDLGVPVGVRMKVGSSRKGVSAVSLPRDVHKGVVIVGESGNESSDSSRDVLRVGVIFKVFVVCVNRDRVRGPH